jgi:putative transposase
MGHLFQGRFGCVAMDEAHWVAPVRYIEFDPVLAGLCQRAQDWPCAETLLGRSLAPRRPRGKPRAATGSKQA